MFGVPERIVIFINEEKIPEAEKWYSDILERAPLFSSKQLVSFAINGVYLILQSPGSDITNPFQPGYSYNTQVYWYVQNLESALEKLKNKGALQTSEIIDNPIAKNCTVTDPFGNFIGLTENRPKPGQSIDAAPSETALRAAFNRALAWKSDQLPKGNDYLAQIFLSEEQKSAVSSKEQREKLLEALLMKKQYGFFLARTNYIDDIFSDALKRNIYQVVFLGAGYDTRCIRFREQIRDTCIFELDAPATQQHKLKIYKKGDIEVPAQVKFVPVNFLKDNFGEALARFGYEPGRETLFIWEGVTYYLDEAAIGNTLDFISQNKAERSRLVFDHQITEVPSISSGEPFLFWKPVDEIRNMLEEKGFRIIEQLSPEAMEEKLLSYNGKQVHQVSPYFAFCLAEINY